MAQQRHVVVLLMLACLFTSSYSYQFTVGGKDGWVPNPSVDYNTWSQHMRFIINDSVLFKYKQGADSVLEVSKDDYDKCNTGNPIKKMEDGNSIFTLDRSGPFYFISGNKDNCDKGQKLQIIVISVRNQGKPPQTPAPGVAPPSNNGSTTPSPTGSPPSTGGSSPVASPPKGSSTPGTPSAPSANAPAGSSTPGASSPNGAPVSTPAGKSPTSSPTPSGSTASPPAPATGGSVAPAANGPSTSTPGSSSPVAGEPSSGSGIAPAAGGPSSFSGIAPSAGGPSGSGIAPAAGGPAGSMSPGPSAGGPLAGGPSAGAPGSSASGPGGSNTPADINSPAGAPENPNSFAVKAFTPSIVLVSAVSLVLTVALGEFIILP